MCVQRYRNKRHGLRYCISRINMDKQVETLTKLPAPLKKYVVLQAQFYGKENNTL